MLAGEVSAEEKDNMLCSLAEFIHDIQAVGEYAEQAEAEINFMCTPEYWGKEQ
ncbi:MAG: hypothetical protein ACI8PB_000337 [Desulforhopalus sp.]|jgi:hypothetical protein